MCLPTIIIVMEKLYFFKKVSGIFGISQHRVYMISLQLNCIYFLLYYSSSHDVRVLSVVFSIMCPDFPLVFVVLKNKTCDKSTYFIVIKLTKLHKLN
ncbi:hypothetical protein C9I73_103 [Candidatus Karelsulcia muelleri]|uniref:Uncharacterized protein n=1 Tax=Candidatus Karelsulcia muelleri TaxID=336810 RepID=A0A346E0Y5_9FLAO|nr:hypothetical protein C9I73_103 [Candidatus Karelsulcia muelleri]